MYGDRSQLRERFMRFVCWPDHRQTFIKGKRLSSTAIGSSSAESGW